MALEFRKAQELWQEQARIEAQNNRDLRYQQGKSPCNVFILDTSSSIGMEGFLQMKDLFCTIIDEYANYPHNDENVAVIICGRRTKIQHYYSNQYMDLKHCLSISKQFLPHNIKQLRLYE
ncbi:uncharacterized protein LOC134245214, partial [Saccostrea cucullata]|uniref:uncharacterized protein LOC134245214 n=1 Tax=Saccostrea cuccullata TaxID=36930 RepID=UPI002ED28CE1